MFAFSLAGLIVGAAVGLTGVGGGSMMTPWLIYGFGLPPVSAVGTDLLFSGATKAFGAALHGRQNTIAWRIVFCMALGSVPGVLITLCALRALSQWGGVPHGLITGVLSIALLGTGLGILLRTGMRRLGTAAAPNWLLTLRRPSRLGAVTAGVGFLLGISVTLSSVGAGAIGTVFLMGLYPELTASEVVGTDVTHAVLLSLLAGFGHASIGTVEPSVLTALLVGSLPGMYLGTRLGHGVPDRVLRHTLAMGLVVLGAGMLL
ncbi:MAG TPA: sulfite exporter TauE/SafE family protein [Gammaproteobacteria bacterium]|nr:sulfite exporter TauE/SafE family protein [Gammaproteobacteria bacterium]